MKEQKYNEFLFLSVSNSLSWQLLVTILIKGVGMIAYLEFKDIIFLLSCKITSLLRSRL